MNFNRSLLSRQGEGNTIEEIYDRKNNAFDLLRFLLATLVIYSHCYPLLQGEKNSGDLLGRLTASQTDCGAFAVICFFIISGFLITQSLQNSKTYRAYLLKRILRIIPAFFVSLFLISFVLGPFVTHLSLGDYFRDDGTSGPFSFILRNITFNVFGYSWTVHDVFANNPFPSSANGSMWTLKSEFLCYLCIVLLSYFYIFKHRILTLAVTALSGLLLILHYACGFSLLSFPSGAGWIFHGGWLFNNGEYGNFVSLSFYFMAGSCIYIFKDKIHFHVRWLLLALIVLLVSAKLNLLNYAMIFVLPYLIIAVAARFKLSSIRKYGDFSYGMYIYAFPIQQTLVFLWRNSLNIKTLFLLSFACTLCMSFFSWKFVENPVLQLKRKL